MRATVHQQASKCWTCPRFLTIFYSHKNFMVISQMVQKLSRWQTHTPTHPQTYTTENNILLRTSIVSLHYCCVDSNNMRTFYNQQLVDLRCTSRSLTISLLTCEIVYIGYQFSSGWSTRSVYWSTSVSIKQLHHIWLRCAFPSQQQTTDVASALQHTATWQFYESD